MRVHRFRGRPPWWPANEPWPPRRQFGHRRRIGCVFTLVLLLGAMGATTIVSTALRRAGVGMPTGRGLVVVSAISVAVTFALLLGALRRFGLPMASIVEAADRVANGDLTTRVAEHGPPSIRSVARAFNSMTARLQSEEERRRRFMADVAHELRTPLTVLQGRIEGLLDGIYPRTDQQLGEVLADARFVARLVQDLQTLASAESGTLTLQKEPTDIAALAQDVINSFASEANAGGVTLGADVPGSLPAADVDPVRIRQVLANLISNALRHTPRGGRVDVSATMRGGQLAIAVADTGSGIPADELPRIFDRFFKGSASRGSGLGLTIARNLVAAHGGDVTAASTAGRGTTITVTLSA